MAQGSGPYMLSSPPSDARALASASGCREDGPASSSSPSAHRTCAVGCGSGRAAQQRSHTHHGQPGAATGAAEGQRGRLPAAPEARSSLSGRGSSRERVLEAREEAWLYVLRLQAKERSERRWGSRRGARLPGTLRAGGLLLPCRHGCPRMQPAPCTLSRHWCSGYDGQQRVQRRPGTRNLPRGLEND